jgi:hypothetical protein
MTTLHGDITRHLEEVGQQSAQHAFERRQGSVSTPASRASGIRRYLRGYFQEHPWRAVLTGVGLGVLLAATLYRARSR